MSNDHARLLGHSLDPASAGWRAVVRATAQEASSEDASAGEASATGVSAEKAAAEGDARGGGRSSGSNSGGISGDVGVHGSEGTASSAAECVWGAGVAQVGAAAGQDACSGAGRCRGEARAGASLRPSALGPRALGPSTLGPRALGPRAAAAAEGAARAERDERREVAGFQDMLRAQAPTGLPGSGAMGGGGGGGGGDGASGGEGGAVLRGDGSLGSDRVLLASFSNWMKVCDRMMVSPPLFSLSSRPPLTFKVTVVIRARAFADLS